MGIQVTRVILFLVQLDENKKMHLHAIKFQVDFSHAKYDYLTQIAREHLCNILFRVRPHTSGSKMIFIYDRARRSSESICKANIKPKFLRPSLFRRYIKFM